MEIKILKWCIIIIFYCSWHPFYVFERSRKAHQLFNFGIFVT